MVPDAIILSPEPNMKPINVPTADFNAPPMLLFSWSHSARKAPKRLHGIIPIGVRNNPKIIPMVAPVLPAFVPPASFVNRAGIV